MKIFRREVAFWEMVFYASWSVLTIWFILKMAGFINTPKWLEFGVPVASLIIGILGLFKNLMDSINKLAITTTLHTLQLKHIEKDVEFVKNDIEFLKRKIA